MPIFYLPSWAHPIDADVFDLLLQSRVSPVSDVYCYYSYLSWSLAVNIEPIWADQMLLIEYGVVRTQEMEVLKLKNVNRLETLHPDHICCCHAWLGGSSINVRRRSWHDTNIGIETRLTLYPDFEKNIHGKLSRDGVCRKYYLQFRLFYTDTSTYL